MVRGKGRVFSWLVMMLLWRAPAYAQAVAPAEQASNTAQAAGITQGKPPALSVAERLGYPAEARLLILHADDLGMMRSVNRATLEALEKGWVTSASILVVCPWFPEVARWAREHPEADLGVHLALNSEWTGMRWGPVSRAALVPTLVDAEGYLPLVEETVARQAAPADVEQELRAQIERARGAGIAITHLDSHMGTLWRMPELFETYLRVARAYGLPALLTSEGQSRFPEYNWKGTRVGVDRTLGMAPGVPIQKWLRAYKEMLAALPPGVYELVVHLGYDDEELRGATFDHPDWGAAWRQADFDLVRNPEFQQFLREQKFILISWKNLARALKNEK